MIQRRIVEKMDRPMLQVTVSLTNTCSRSRHVLFNIDAFNLHGVRKDVR